MNYENMTDFEINKAVTVALGVEVTEGEFLKYQKANKPRVPAKQDCPVHIWVDYCNNPSDAWPIILENQISINAKSKCDYEIGMYQFTGEWRADAFISCGGEFGMGDDVIKCANENPLRAAMIVYLMMNEKQAEK